MGGTCREGYKLTMQNLHHLICRLSSTSLGKSTNTSRLLKENVGSNLILDSVSTLKHAQGAWLTSLKEFSAKSGGFDEGDAKNEWDRSVSESFSGTTSDDLGWDSVSSWSTGLTKEHFDGEAVGRRTSGGGDSPKSPQSSLVSGLQEIEDRIREIDAENRKNEGFMDKWGERMREMSMLLKQVREPGARGSYLKDSEKAEMYRLHKENPEVYTVEKLAKDYRIMRQRVHAILWLKELEEEEEKKLGHPLDDSVELLLDTCPEYVRNSYLAWYLVLISNLIFTFVKFEMDISVAS